LNRWHFAGDSKVPTSFTNCADVVIKNMHSFNRKITMKFNILKSSFQLAAALGFGAMALSAQAAGPVGCQAKGSLYIVKNGNFISTIAVTPGAGTTAAASNQGHVGFKTDTNGLFTISFPPQTLSSGQVYYFRMETYNSQYLAYGTGTYGNTFTTLTSPVSGQIVCAGTTPSQQAGVNLGAPILSTGPIPECYVLAKTSGGIANQICYGYRAYSPTYYVNMPSPGLNGYSLFMDISTNGNNSIPRCTQVEPATTAAASPVDSKGRCLRKYYIVGPVNGINHHTTIGSPRQNWVQPSGAIDGDQIAYPN
jgi:hypothetical protein